MYRNISYMTIFCGTALFRPKQGFCLEQCFLADGFSPFLFISRLKPGVIHIKPLWGNKNDFLFFDFSSIIIVVMFPVFYKFKKIISPPRFLH